MGFLAGKRALIVGLATERSIAHGIATAMRREGAELAFSYQDRFTQEFFISKIGEDAGEHADPARIEKQKQHARDKLDYVLKYAPCEVIVIRQALPDWITESMEWS